MADSTVSDVSKMKLVELRKELKSRGLSATGDKAELISRLQEAMSHDENGDINLDSDEIDSDGVLEDEDDKSQGDILDDSAVDTLNEELALSEQTAPAKPASEPKQPRTLKRKLITSKISKDKSDTDQSSENKEAAAKKIVLNRATSITSEPVKVNEEKEKISDVDNSSGTNKLKITTELDAKTRLELRAKRFGLPVKISDDARKEARKHRFGQNTPANNTVTTLKTGTPTENMEKLRKRAERFGQSVSKMMSDIENKEKLEKRKAKFGVA